MPTVVCASKVNGKHIILCMTCLMNAKEKMVNNQQKMGG